MRRSKRTGPIADPRLLYADSSALVKLAVEEFESAELRLHLADRPRIFTSAIGRVEISRAVRIASPSTGRRDAELVLERCVLVAPGDSILRQAAELAGQSLRTLDAIHLASALWTEPDEMISYDRRLSKAGREHGLHVVSPGME